MTRHLKRTGPTTGAETLDGRDRWAARPRAARAVRAFAVLSPPVAAVGASVAVALLLGARGIELALPLDFLILGLTAWTALVLMERAMRRLLPLAALLALTLVFPDHAPSRFALALRSGGSKRLRTRIDALGEDRIDPDFAAAAGQILWFAQALNVHDRRTRGHCERVRGYAVLLGQQLGIEGDDLEKLQWGALLHDVGKLDVPSTILNKDGRPTDEEWDVLAQHPSHGGRLIAPLAPWLGEWSRASSEHHERWDGAGYPSGLAGDEISLAGRIVCVADAFEVMTAVRSYKPALSVEAARQELTRCAGAQFDPLVVRAMLEASLGDITRIRGPVVFAAQLPIAGLTSGAPAGAAVAKAAAAVAIAGGLVVASIAAPSGQPADLTSAAAGPTSSTSAVSATGSPPNRDPDATGRGSTTTVADAGPGVGDDTAPEPGAASASGVGPEVRSGSPSSTALGTPPWTLAPTPGPGLPPLEIPPPVAPDTTGPSPAPGPFTMFLGTAGPGNTVSSPNLPLVAAAPTAPALANYDTDRDAFPGLLLAKGGSAPDETDPTKRQVWASAGAGPTAVRGTATLVIWAASKDFESDKGNRLRIELQDCDAGLGNCRSLGAGSGAVDASGPGFKPLAFDLGPVDSTIAAGRRVVVRIAVQNASDDDCWLAYGTTGYPAALTIG